MLLHCFFCFLITANGQGYEQYGVFERKPFRLARSPKPYFLLLNLTIKTQNKALGGLRFAKRPSVKH
jgi:hypothetical protein